MDAPARPILAYAAPADAPKRWRRWIALALTIPAAVVPFLPFTYDTSPYNAASEFFREWFSDLEIVCAGLSFFIVLPLIAWRLRILLWRAPRITELRLAAIVAMLCHVPAIYLLVEFCPNLLKPEPDYFLGVAALSTMLICILAGMIIAWRCRRTRSTAAVDALLLGPYLANAAFCLFAFYQDPQIGYWLTTIATTAFAVQLVMIPISARRRIHAA